MQRIGQEKYHTFLIQFAITLFFLVINYTALVAHAGTITTTTGYEYDPVTGFLKAQIREPDNAQLQLRRDFTYDKFGNRLKVDVSSTATGLAAIAARTARTLTYDPNGVAPRTITNALGQQIATEFNLANLPVYIQALNGLVSTYTYDIYGRKTIEKRPDGTQTKWDYQMCGGSIVCPSQARYVVSMNQYGTDGTTVIGPWRKIYSDDLDRQVRVETLAFDGVTVSRQDTEYDALGRVYRASLPYYANSTIQWTTFAYDQVGRVVLATAPNGARTTTSYNGFTTVTTNDLGQTQTTIGNGRGQRIEVRDARNNVLRYQYDAQGNLIKTIDPAGNVITMSYDLLGRKTTTTDVDLGALTYEYDAAGNLRKQTDAKGNITTFDYDLLGRMTKRAEPDLVSTWTYDTCDYGKGRLCRATADNGYSAAYSFDNYGRPSQTVTTIDTTYTVTKTYDVNGRLATQVYPTGFGLKYVYTKFGYLAEVRNKSTNALYWQANAMDAMGNILQETYGNNLVTQTVFDPATNRKKNIYAGAGNSVQNLSFSYDTIGNLLSRSDANQNLSETFSYDSLNRLTSNTVNSSGAGIVAQSYTYDAIGNITSRSDAGAYTYGGVNAGPHALTAVTRADGAARQFSYDASGNLEQEVERDSANNVIPAKGRTETWTSFNMPLTLTSPTTSVRFVYGPEHQRIKKITPGYTTYYLHPDSSGGLFYEKDAKSDGTFEFRYFITAGDAGVVALVANQGVLYLHRDNLGSTTAVTNASGTVVERMAYEPFGKRRTPVGALDPNGTLAGVNTNRGYTNHEELDSLGLVHMNGRVYDPAVGRFLSADPNVPDPLNLQSYNRYAYVRNNPLRYVDPTGFEEEADELSGGSSGGGGGGGEAGGFSGTYYNAESGITTTDVTVEVVDGMTVVHEYGTINSANTTPGDFVSAKSAPATDGSAIGQLDIPSVIVQGYRQVMTTFADNNRGIYGWGWAVGLVDRNVQRPDGSAESKVASVAIFALSLRSPKAAEDALAKIVRKTSKIDRSAFRLEREAFWKREAQQNASAYSAADLERMKNGHAPIGPDGFPMELHHVDGTPEGGVAPKSRTDHRLGTNYKLNHPDD